jgi:hypothetical protein
LAVAWLATSTFGQRVSSTPRNAAAGPLPEILREFEKDWRAARLPDFSYAGYRAGTAEPAKVAGPVFKVEDFGAVADDGKDDIDAIQAAVDAAAKAGGGVVTFAKGQYDFDVGTQGRFVKIRASNIVIRGAGSGTGGEGGTVLFDHTFSDTPVPGQTWQANRIVSFFHAGPFTLTDRMDYTYGPDPDELKPVTSVDDASRNATELTVVDASGLKAGTTYLLAQLDPDDSLVRALTAPMQKIAQNHLGRGWKVQQLVTVERVDGKKVTLGAPVRWPLAQKYTPSLFPVETLREVGIEDLRLKTAWKGPFKHHANVEGNDGWNHVRFDLVENGWVRNVVHDGTTMAVMLASTKNCLVSDCAIEGPTGHNGFVVIGCATDNLYRDLDGGRAFHTFQFQGNPSGNVFLRVKGSEPSALDSHGGLAVTNLFDGASGLVYSGGGSDKNVPPRHAAGLVLWNWKLGQFNPYNRKQADTFARVNEVPGFIAVGVSAADGRAVNWQDAANKPQTKDVSGEGAYVESLGKPVGVASLYEWQKQRRTQPAAPPVRSRR